MGGDNMSPPSVAGTENGNAAGLQGFSVNSASILGSSNMVGVLGHSKRLRLLQVLGESFCGLVCRQDDSRGTSGNNFPQLWESFFKPGLPGDSMLSLGEPKFRQLSKVLAKDTFGDIKTSLLPSKLSLFRLFDAFAVDDFAFIILSLTASVLGV